MTIQDIKKVIFIIFMFGFFAGILYLNLFAKNWIMSIGMFGDYFLEQYSVSKIDSVDYIWYITKLRIVPFVLMAIPVNINFKRTIAMLFLVWTGFSSGLILTTAVMKLGVKGIGLCIAGISPHFVCYVTSFVIILNYLLSYPDVRWNNTKMLSTIIFILLGIVTETFINPVLVEIYIKIL